MFPYQKLLIYKLAKELVIDVYNVTNSFPKHELFGLTSQMKRAAISIPANISEGSGRASIKEQSHFLTISYSSLMELSCQMEIAFDIGFISEKVLKDFMLKSKDLSVRISNYKKFVEKPK